VSAIGLFIVGALVTLIVAAAMALLIYAAILDGRDAAARRAGDSNQFDTVHTEDRVPLPARL
jgi:hypothetical protein